MSTSQKVRASELASKNKADLLAQLTELRTELATLRVQKVVGGSSSKLTKMCVCCGVVCSVRSWVVEGQGAGEGQEGCEGRSERLGTEHTASWIVGARS